MPRRGLGPDFTPNRLDELRETRTRQHRRTMIAVAVVWAVLLFGLLVGAWFVVTSPEAIGAWLGRMASSFEAQS